MNKNITFSKQIFKLQASTSQFYRIDDKCAPILKKFQEEIRQEASRNPADP
jgi:hypothetical protein